MQTTYSALTTERIMCPVAVLPAPLGTFEDSGVPCGTPGGDARGGHFGLLRRTIGAILATIAGWLSLPGGAEGGAWATKLMILYAPAEPAERRKRIDHTWESAV